MHGISWSRTNVDIVAGLEKNAYGMATCGAPLADGPLAGVGVAVAGDADTEVAELLHGVERADLQGQRLQCVCWQTVAAIVVA